MCRFTWRAGSLLTAHSISNVDGKGQGCVVTNLAYCAIAQYKPVSSMRRH